jgi:hypothetical protein
MASMTPQPEPTGRLGFSGVAPVRVLIAEDFALYRRFILSTLASLPDLQVIGGGTCCKNQFSLQEGIPRGSTHRRSSWSFGAVMDMMRFPTFEI